VNLSSGGNPNNYKGKKDKMTKTVLIATSQGERGQDGKKKIYEIVVEGNTVTMMWGKAEEARRQTKREFFANSFTAQMFATDKKWEKVNKGYTVAFTA